MSKESGVSSLVEGLQAFQRGLVILGKGTRDLEKRVRASSVWVHYLFGGGIGYVVGYLVARFVV